MYLCKFLNVSAMFECGMVMRWETEKSKPSEVTSYASLGRHFISKDWTKHGRQEKV